jgi:hypothetical protein
LLQSRDGTQSIQQSPTKPLSSHQESTVTDIHTASRRNSRLALSQVESAAVGRLLQETQERAQRYAAGTQDEQRLKLKRALSAATRELFGKENTNVRELSKKLAEQEAPLLAKLKGASESLEDAHEIPDALSRFALRDHLSLQDSYVHISRFHEIFDHLRPVPYLVDPAFARELWWGETHSFWSGPGLSVDIENDPCRIWGHIAYDQDNLLSGNVGVSKFFFLTPDRFPVRAGNAFEIRPRAQIGGWASGWTGLYHPVWHADDKWSKCWQNLRVTASLSSGEILDTSTLNFNCFSLEDELGVGQGNASLTMGWVPVLRFNADLADLRARGVAIILELELRYDYQLEGESDLWLRNRPGSDAESVASFDNAVTFRVFPGSVLSV